MTAASARAVCPLSSAPPACAPTVSSTRRSRGPNGTLRSTASSPTTRVSPRSATTIAAGRPRPVSPMRRSGRVCERSTTVTFSSCAMSARSGRVVSPVSERRARSRPSTCARRTRPSDVCRTSAAPAAPTRERACSSTTPAAASVPAAACTSRMIASSDSISERWRPARAKARAASARAPAGTASRITPKSASAGRSRARTGADSAASKPTQSAIAASTTMSAVSHGARVRRRTAACAVTDRSNKLRWGKLANSAR